MAVRARAVCAALSFALVSACTAAPEAPVATRARENIVLSSECLSCETARCGATYAACDASADCRAILACTEPCMDEYCYQQCGQTYPAGRAAFVAHDECLLTSCSTECELGALQMPSYPSTPQYPSTPSYPSTPQYPSTPTPMATDDPCFACELARCGAQSQACDYGDCNALFACLDASCATECGSGDGSYDDYGGYEDW